jgi:uncharacterized cupin superfamily protein
MPPTLIANPANMNLPDAGPVAAPLGQPVVQLKCAVSAAIPERQIEAGVWEASPGKWRRQIVTAEFCHFLSGRCTFTPDDGPPLEIKAGDAVFFPPNSLGVWHVHETVRKTYVSFDYKPLSAL